jgi:hypothetical protein
VSSGERWWVATVDQVCQALHEARAEGHPPAATTRSESWERKTRAASALSVARQDGEPRHDQ